MKVALSLFTLVALVLLTMAMLFYAGWDRPPVEAAQTGFRGLAMEQVVNPRKDAALRAINQVPEPPYELPPATGPRASEVYENVPVLGHISQERFDYLMAAITEWVAPEDQGCNYCHNPENLASDEVYTKLVTRRMIEMTWDINAEWQGHVAGTGVTCYTCHRGQPVPSEIWFKNSGPPQARGWAADRAGQNMAAVEVELTSLPFDPYAPLLQEEGNIRVNSLDALPSGHPTGIPDAEMTYALMMHFSGALGVNCTYCHNSRSFFVWDESTPKRTTAWHGINMVRHLNNEYLEPLGPTYPPERLGPQGDAPKAFCATWHQGVFKPLYGASMLPDYPSLAEDGRP